MAIEPLDLNEWSALSKMRMYTVTDRLTGEQATVSLLHLADAVAWSSEAFNAIADLCVGETYEDNYYTVERKE